MIRIPDPGRFELRLMDGSANPYLLQASVLAAGLYGLKNNKDMNDAFGKDVIESYIKLRSSEMNEFKSKDSFDKTKDITKWEKDNTLDC